MTDGSTAMPDDDHDDDGWAASAAAWIADNAGGGDWGRRFVLDPVMLDRVGHGRFTTALDVGCGEGRFCRLLAGRGIRTVGIDPTEPLLAHARQLDPAGDYRPGRAESLGFPDDSFDLVVSYLTLIDIPDVAAAVAEMARVLRPGGSLLIANLTGFQTAGRPFTDAAGRRRWAVDGYLDARPEWVEWSGIRVVNHHRPLSTYMALLLDAGLRLRYFSEPPAVGGDPAQADRYRRCPFFLVMEWDRPPAP